MRRRVLPAIALTLVVAGLVVAGAAAPSAPSALSTPSVTPTALQTLIATGVLPADVSSEPGVWNFAGPAAECPGPGWVCSVPGIFPIVQNGLVNVLQADEACPEAEQNGTYNKMECIDEVKSGPFAHQACNASQTGTHNELICKLIYDVTTSANTQCVVQEAHFDQSGVTNKFMGQLRIIEQMNSSGVQEQDARQLMTGFQNADEKNESVIEQVQIQKMSGAATEQRQNTGCTASEAPVFDADCNEQGEGPARPYTCVQLEQDVEEGGDNISKLKQEVKEEATTSLSSAEEQQGTPDGGNDASVHQDVFSGEGGGDFSSLSNGSSEGKSLGVSDQYTYQKLPTNRPTTLEQQQYEDPWCCFGSQSGGGEDSEEVMNMVVDQIANANAFQEARATGESSTPGKCTIHHDVGNGGGSVDREATSGGSGCPFLRMTTSCTGAGVEGGCSAPPPTTTPPEEDIIFLRTF
jgi:hypothetical protein